MSPLEGSVEGSPEEGSREDDDEGSHEGDEEGSLEDDEEGSPERAKTSSESGKLPDTQTMEGIFGDAADLSSS